MEDERPRLSNVEFVTQLMEYSAHGALIQAFVLQALGQYAALVASKSPEALDTPLVSGHAWHGCATEVRARLTKSFGIQRPADAEGAD